MVKAKESVSSIVEKTTQDLLENIDIEGELEVDQDEDGLVRVKIETQEPGMLIGYRGETLNSIQRLLGMITYRKTDKWTRVLVEINDYRQKKKQRLESLAASVAQKVKFSGQSQMLSPMSSFNRRIIHLALADDSEVETVSEGEGGQRRVVVKPKETEDEQES